MADELKPTFDFTKVSRQWSKAMATSIQNGTRATITLQRPAPELIIPKGTSDEEAQKIRQQYRLDLNEHLDAYNKAVDTMGALSDEQAQLVSQVLVDVPREWLLDNAPQEIDWGKLENFDYIQEPKYAEILSLIQSGEARILAKK